MSADSPRHPAPAPRDEQDDEVWALLAQAAPDEAGAMFSRQVMRTIRMQSHVQQPWWRRLVGPLAIGAATAACGIAIGFSFLSNQGSAPTGAASARVETPTAAGANLAVTEPSDDEMVMTIADLTGDYSHLEVMMLLGL